MNFDLVIASIQNGFFVRFFQEKRVQHVKLFTRNIQRIVVLSSKQFSVRVVNNFLFFKCLGKRIGLRFLRNRYGIFLLGDSGFIFIEDRIWPTRSLNQFFVFFNELTLLNGFQSVFDWLFHFNLQILFLVLYEAKRVPKFSIPLNVNCPLTGIVFQLTC